MDINCEKSPSENDILKLVNKINIDDKSLKIDIDSIQTLFLFMKTAHKMFSIAEKHFSRLNISKGKFNVLMVLFRETSAESGDALSLSDIANSVWVSKSTITGLVDGLEKDGLVERDFSDRKDRRKIKVKLTEKGNEFLNSIFPIHFKALSSFLEKFNKKEKDSLKKNMMKLYKTVDEMKS